MERISYNMICRVKLSAAIKNTVIILNDTDSKYLMNFVEYYYYENEP